MATSMLSTTVRCRNSSLKAIPTRRVRRLSDVATTSVLRASGASSEPPLDPGPSKQSEEVKVSDEEWELRTGRAMYVLQRTLPHFFTDGLAMCGEEEALEGKEKSGVLDGLARGPTSTIYSPNIRLSYTPPVAVPPPFPRTLHVEGLPLYTGSSAFVRQTLKALYADLHVDIRKFVLQSGWSSRPFSRYAGTGSSPEMKLPKSISPYDRQRSLNVAFIVSGTARVSGSRTEWDVDSTYTFSPLSGLITTHVIDSIHPAPHQTVYDALRTALAKLGLNLGDGKRTTPGEAALPSHIPLHIHEQPQSPMSERYRSNRGVGSK